MSTIPGTYIEETSSGNERVDCIIDELTLPILEEYRQIIINYETGTVMNPNMTRFTYQNWQEAFPVEVFLNGGQFQLEDHNYHVDHEMGKIEFLLDLELGDNVMATYCFDYFPYHVLIGMIKSSVDIYNSAGSGQTTSYTIENIPVEHLGIIANLVIAKCMDKLILEYDLWKGRLIFAISNNGIYDGSDSIVAQLESVRQGAEDRAMRALENPKLRAPNMLARPTDHYYEALMVGSSARYKNGSPSYGPLRGAKFNRLMGNLPRG